MTADQHRESVASAARHMDEIKPGWWRNIDPVTLDLSRGATCICGQNGLEWVQVSGLDKLDSFVEMEWMDSFSARVYEPFWLEEIAKRMPSPAVVPATLVRP